MLFVKTALLHDNVFNYYRCNSRSHVIISEGMSLIERINSSIKEDRVKKTLTSADDPVSLQEEAEKEKEPREQLDFLFIENVGNLVCPSSYDLGEDLRVVLLSVTEGEDKPLKYPTIFNSADVAIVAKSDRAAAVEFDWGSTRRNIQAVRLGMRIFQLSAKTGDGVEERVLNISIGSTIALLDTLKKSFRSMFKTCFFLV